MEHNQPRLLQEIVNDYNSINDSDDALLELFATMEDGDIPQTLWETHRTYQAILVALDAERNYAVAYWHNFFRQHYALTHRL